MKKQYRRVISTILLGIFAVFLFPMACISAESTVQTYETEIQGIVVGGCTLVPIRAIGQILDSKLTWDQKTLSATIDAQQPIVFPANSNHFTINGENKLLDIPTFIYQGSLYVPLRSISDSLGYTISWDSKRKLAVVVYKNKNIVVNTTILPDSDIEVMLTPVVKNIISDPAILNSFQMAMKEAHFCNDTIKWACRFHGYTVVKGKLFIVFRMSGMEEVVQGSTAVLTTKNGKWATYLCEGGEDRDIIDIYPGNGDWIEGVVIPIDNVLVIYDPSAGKASFDDKGQIAESEKILKKKIDEMNQQWRDKVAFNASIKDFSIFMDRSKGLYNGELKNGVPNGYGVYQRSIKVGDNYNHAELLETWTGMWLPESTSFFGQIVITLPQGDQFLFDGTLNFADKTFLGTVIMGNMTLEGMFYGANNMFQGTAQFDNGIKMQTTTMVKVYWLISFDNSN